MTCAMARPALTMAALMLTGLVTSVSAQPATSLADVAHRIDAGDRVGVVDAAGVTVWGRLSGVNPDGVTIVDPSGRARAFAAADVRRIERRGDSLRNGLLIGAITGGVLGGAFAGWFSGEFRAADFLQGVAIFGGVGLGIGVAVDAAHAGRTVVYAAVPTAQRLQPPPGRAAVVASVR